MLYFKIIILAVVYQIIIVTSIYSNELEYANKGDSNIYIGKIIVVGNETTKDFIILREMSTKENSVFNLEILAEDLNKIRNLGLFNKVDIIPTPDFKNNKIDLYVTVEEQYYILPIPQAGIEEGDIRKLWVGINLVWRNFRGRNEIVNCSFGIGYQPFFNINFFTPWIGEKEHFFGAFGIKYNKSINKSLSDANVIGARKDSLKGYEIESFSGNITLGKYLTKYLAVSANYTLSVNDFSGNYSGNTFSGEPKEIYGTLSLNTLFDKRNNIFYPTKGNFIKIDLIKYGVFNKFIDFNKFRFDLRNYLPLKLTKNYSISIATRLAGGISFGGNVPSYLEETFGYSEIIRGWDNFVFQGEHLIGFYNEVRIPIINPFYVKGTDHFLLKRISFARGFSYQYGLYGTIFLDIGGVMNRTEEVSNVIFRKGFGAGLNMILPFNIVARTDLAFRSNNGKLKPRLVFGLSAFF